MIKITEEIFRLTKLNISSSNTSYPIDIYIKMPDDCNKEEFIIKMEEYISKTIKRGDILGLYEATKKFISVNDISYYEVYKIG